MRLEKSNWVCPFVRKLLHDQRSIGTKGYIRKFVEHILITIGTLRRKHATMSSQKLFLHDSVSLPLDIHGTSEMPLFSLGQVGMALCLPDVEERISSFDTDEVVVYNNVSYLTEMGVLRLSRDGQSPWSAAFGKWTVKVAKEVAKEELLAEKKALKEENAELLSKRLAEEWVYAIRNLADPRDDIHKVGMTGDLDSRTSTLGTAMPDGVARCFSMKCVDGKLCEKIVHMLLKKKNYRKEWFRLDLPSLILTIKAAVYVGDALVRNLDCLTEEKVENIKRALEHLEEPVSSKRQRVDDQDSESLSLQKWLVEHLTPSETPKKFLHTHKVLAAYKKYLNQPSCVGFTITKFNRKLVELNYNVTRDHQKDTSCCSSALRCFVGLDFI